VKRWLLDTGPVVAYLDADDPAHDAVATCWNAFSGRLVTSSAVITEAMHFVAVDPAGPRRLAALATAGAMEIYDVSGSAELHAAAALMEKYADTPMDFADATLVLLAELLGIGDVLTLDRRGFSAYRTRTGRGLRLALDS
jgi:predicted nucleic acid-binding protein